MTDSITSQIIDLYSWITLYTVENTALKSLSFAKAQDLYLIILRYEFIPHIRKHASGPLNQLSPDPLSIQDLYTS